METKGKVKKDIIKNILIIFLLIMLVLTFFSNTIMNRSLPEVSTQYASYKQINDNIKATATVSANQDYVITFDESREIAEVLVRRGDKVSRGDVIYTLVPNESNELSEAQKALNLLLIQKEQLLKNGSNTVGGTDYDAEISDKKEKLAELKASLDNFPVFDTKLAELEAEIEALEEALEAPNEKLEELNGQMNRYESNYYTVDEINTKLAEDKKLLEEYKAAYESAKASSDSKEAEIEALKAEIEKIDELIAECDEKISEYSKKKLEYAELLSSVASGNQNLLSLRATMEEAQTSLLAIQREYHYYKLYKEAEKAYNTAPPEEEDAARAAYEAAYAEYQSVSGGDLHDEKYYLDLVDSRSLALSRAEAAYEAALALGGEESAYQKKVTYYENLVSKYELEKSEHNKTVEKKNKQITVLQKELTKLSESESEYETAYKKYESAVELGESRLNYALLRDEAKVIETEIKALNKTLAEKKKELDEFKLDDPGNEKSVREQIKQTERDIEKLEREKEEAGKVDPHDAEIKRLELLNLERDINEQYKTINKIQNKLTTTEITSPVSGTVTSLAYSAGEDITAGGEVASVAMSEKGYTMEFSATNEQASRIKIGEIASVQNFYWGEKPEITVTALKNDTSNPGRGKIVVLSVVGDSITVGQSLTFTLGERAKSYDKVVPNSALREDSNGKFVLVVESKSTPLGNRYTARRVDVEVIASDETSSALSGELMGGEFIITTASAPVSDGTQVRLADK